VATEAVLLETSLFENLAASLMTMHHPGVTEVSITSVTPEDYASETDEVSVEEPLQIDVGAFHEGGLMRLPMAVTMRTPGSDRELAAGFLFTEGVIRSKNDLVDFQTTAPNTVLATLHAAVPVDPAQFDRHSFVASSCGVCGKRSIAAVLAMRRPALQPGLPRIESEVVHRLPETQRAAQINFQRTGGLHAAALFDLTGRLLAVHEDVGRHNALDKLIGTELLAGRLPLANRIVLLSGRTSFELIQKASVAGITIVAAVGAPTSLAVALAREARMTLLGFVRDERFNVYSDAGRLVEAVAEFPR
jgi:FdhD protein